MAEYSQIKRKKKRRRRQYCRVVNGPHRIALVPSFGDFVRFGLGLVAVALVLLGGSRTVAMGRFWFGGRGPWVLGLGLRFFVLTPSKLFCSGVLTMREFKATWAL